MILEFTEQALDDYNHWKKNDPDKAVKIKRLIANTLETPFTGLGKPEALRFDLAGCWSRRIDREHRLVYKVDDDKLVILACRFHYG